MNSTSKVRQKTFGVFLWNKLSKKIAKHIYSEKITVVELNKHGNGSNSISKSYKLKLINL